MSKNKFLEASVLAGVKGFLGKEKRKLIKKSLLRNEAFSNLVKEEVFWINEVRKLVKEVGLSDEVDFDPEAMSRGEIAAAPPENKDTDRAGLTTILKKGGKKKGSSLGNRITKSDFNKLLNLEFEKMKEKNPESWARIETMKPNERAIFDKDIADKLIKAKGLKVVSDEAFGKAFSKLGPEKNVAIQNFGKKLFEKLVSASLSGEKLPPSLISLAKDLFGVDVSKNNSFKKFAQKDGSIDPKVLDQAASEVLQNAPKSETLKNFLFSRAEVLPVAYEKEIEDEAQAKNLPNVGKASSKIGSNLYSSGVGNALGHKERVALRGLEKRGVTALSDDEQSELEKLQSSSSKPSRLADVDEKIRVASNRLKNLEKSLQSSSENPLRAKKIKNYMEDVKNQLSELQSLRDELNSEETVETSPERQNELQKRKEEADQLASLKKQEDENRGLRAMRGGPTLEKQTEKELSPTQLAARLAKVAQRDKIKITPEVQAKMEQLANQVVSRSDIGRTKMLDIIDNIDIEKVLEYFDYFYKNPEEIERAKKESVWEPSALQGKVESPNLKSILGSDSEESIFQPELSKASAAKKKAQEKEKEAILKDIKDVEDKLRSTSDVDERESLSMELADLKDSMKFISQDVKGPLPDVSKVGEEDILNRVLDPSISPKAAKKAKEIRSQLSAEDDVFDQAASAAPARAEMNKKIEPLRKYIEKVQSQIDQIRSSSLSGQEKVQKVNNLKFEIEIATQKINAIKKDYDEKTRPSKEALKKRLAREEEAESLESPSGIQGRAAQELANVANAEDENKAMIRQRIEAMRGAHPIEIKQLQRDVSRLESELEQYAQPGTPRHEKLSQELAAKKAELAKVKTAPTGELEANLSNMLTKIRGPKQLTTPEDVVDVLKKVKDPITGQIKSPEKVKDLSGSEFSLAKLLAKAGDKKQLQAKSQEKKPEHFRPSKAIQDFASSEKEKSVPSKDSPLTNIQARKDYEGELSSAERARKKELADKAEREKKTDRTGISRFLAKQYSPEKERERELQQAMKIAQYDMDVRNQERLAKKQAELDDKAGFTDEADAAEYFASKERLSHPEVAKKGLPRIGQPYYGAGGTRLADLVRLQQEKEQSEIPDKETLRKMKMKSGGKNVDPNFLKKLAQNKPGYGRGQNIPDVQESLLTPDGKEKEVEPTKNWDKAVPAKRMKLTLIELIKRGLIK